MAEFMKELASLLFAASRFRKKVLLVFFDSLILCCAWLFAFFLLGISSSIYESGFYFATFAASWLLGLQLANVYRVRLRHLGIALVRKVMICGMLPLFLVAITVPFDISTSETKAGLLAWLFTLNGLIGYRVAVRQIYFRQFVEAGKKADVMILGTASVSLEMAMAALNSTEYNVLALIAVQGEPEKSSIHGINVFHVTELSQQIDALSPDILVVPDNFFSDEILVPIVGLATAKKITVKKIPTVTSQIALNGDSQIFSDIEIEDILPRGYVEPDLKLLTMAAHNKRILITGAAGSIGSQLAATLSTLSPRRLVLLDNNEFGIYQLEQQFEKSHPHGLDVRFVVESITDREAIFALFESESFDAVYHAAAYKHVPLVEDNPFSAVNVNVEGTRNLIDASKLFDVSAFTLISSDKAVRPTNIMGATKRIAELACSAASIQSDNLVISMVRFGNVMNSSGSVIPKFRAQVEAGGPVTVTHPEILRYFMSIKEAAELVIQASALARGGEVFLLDMGEPVKLTTIAETLISLARKKPVYDKQPGLNEIKIVFTGLRSGEKMYEELLVNEDSIGTVHSKIKMAYDTAADPSVASRVEALVIEASKARDYSALIAALSHNTIGYSPETKSS